MLSSVCAPIAVLRLVSVAISLDCESNQVHISVTKKCMDWGYEESYNFLSGTEVLITSAPFANNEQRTDEYCLNATTNNQYTFNMHDGYRGPGDSWTNGAWVSVEGPYGNVVFKGFMIEKTDENIPMSFYYPIMKTQEWKTLASTSSIPSQSPYLAPVFSYFEV